MADYAKLLSAARRAVTDACTACRAVQADMDTVRAITKEDKSPVTIADFASQAVVAHRLTEALGPVHLVAEEASDSLRDPAHALHAAAAMAAAREVWPECTGAELLAAIDVGGGSGVGELGRGSFWTLDPIDGTKGFLRGQQYAVCLAYIENGRPTLGVLGCPNLPIDFSAPLDTPDPHGCLYFAVLGEGLYEVSLSEPGANPTHIRRLDHDPAEPISVCTSVEEGHSDVDAVERIMALTGPRREPARLDSQCKYAVVGRGQADAYLRLPTRKGYVERIWDHAAGAIIAAEGGCAVTDIRGDQLDFSHGRGLEKNRGIVCAPPRVHGRLLAAIGELGIG